MEIYFVKEKSNFALELDGKIRNKLIWIQKVMEGCGKCILRKVLCMVSISEI